ADIIADASGHTAVGTLTIKDQSQPVSFPITITVDGNVATAEGSTELNRMGFNIGASQQDEGTLGFTVGVSIALTAARGTQPAPAS
ncbi:MAG: YceI family protein, partial [Pseudomonadota bacterium]